MTKTVLITGATSGIGQATTRKFAAEGYTVFATHRSDHHRQTLADLDNVTPVQADVTNTADIAAAYDTIATAVGDDGLYAIINNAGVTYTAPFEHADEAKARHVMDVNLWAPWHITQTFIPLLKAHNATNDTNARVINIASWAGILAQPFNGAYNASKFAIIGLTEAMHYDLGLLDIHAITASPGITKTPLLEATTDSGLASLDEMPTDEARDFYRPHLEHMTEMSQDSSDSRFFLKPTDIADRLHKIAETKNPDPKYNLAIDAKFMENFLRRFIPFGIRESIFRRMYALD